MAIGLTDMPNLASQATMIASPTEPFVIVVVVNYNGLDDTIECLQSLHQVTYPNFDIVVVDNGSSDGSVETLETYFPELLLMSLDTNRGFTGGANAGIRAALAKGADYVLLLNNDTIVAPDFLTLLVETAEGDPTVGIVGPRIYNADEPDRIWFEAGSIQAKRSRVRLWDVGKRGTPTCAGQCKTDFVIGCAMLVRAAVFRDVGLLDDDYFVHNEDLDFCYRVGKAGWRLKANSDAHVWHKVGGTLEADADLRWYYATRNRLLFISKNLSWRNRILAYAHFVVTRFARFISWVVQGRSDLVYSASQGCWDFIRKRYGEKQS